MKFPIFIKLTAIILTLLLLTVFPLTQKSMAIFEASARRSAEEMNLNLSSKVASEIESIFINNTERAKTVASFLLKEQNEFDNPMLPYSLSKPENNQVIENILKLDKDLWAIELYKVENNTPILLKRLAQEEKFKKINKLSTILDKIKKKEQISFTEIITNEIIITSLVQDKELPLVLFAAPLSKNANGQVDYFVASYLDIQKLQSVVSTYGGRQLFVTNPKGSILVHSNDKITIDRTNFLHHQAIQKANSDISPKKQIRYQYEGSNEYFMGAYTRNSLKLIIVSEVPEKTVLSQVNQVKRQSIHIAGLIISFMLILVFLFSVSITNPIEIMSDLTQQVKKGNFNIKAQTKVKSNDEIGELATAFDEMIDGLKERDKVKTLFSKFHGSSVAQEMLTNEIGVKGSNKEITVFFSDVRGFTAFSEGHTPEEVVEMLNEYFAVMVSIINRNYGVVDKFIGDAIMAVWGAPQSTGKDSYWCLKSCMEMRVALNDLNEKRKLRGQMPIMIGMGVHSGKAISGTIGSEERMEYTVIGDTVNQTSRIESSTKAFGTDLLISHETAEQVKSHFIIEFAGSAEVKGKSEPLKLYKIQGYIDDEGRQIEVKTPYSEYNKEETEKIKVVA